MVQPTLSLAYRGGLISFALAIDWVIRTCRPTVLRILISVMTLRLVNHLPLFNL